MRSVIAMVVTCLCLASETCLGLSLGDYYQSRGSQAMNLFISGVGAGFFWANVFDSNRGTPIYCPPAKLTITTDMYVSLLEQELKNPSPGASYTSDIPVEAILIRSLIARFPC